MVLQRPRVVSSPEVPKHATPQELVPDGLLMADVVGGSQVSTTPHVDGCPEWIYMFDMLDEARRLD